MSEPRLDIDQRAAARAILCGIGPFTAVSLQSDLAVLRHCLAHAGCYHEMKRHIIRRIETVQHSLMTAGGPPVG